MRSHAQEPEKSNINSSIYDIYIQKILPLICDEGTCPCTCSSCMHARAQ